MARVSSKRLLTEDDVRDLSVRAARTAIQQALEDGWLPPGQARVIRAEAWAEGYATCLGDFDIAARAESRSPNPYVPSTEAK